MNERVKIGIAFPPVIKYTYLSSAGTAQEWCVASTDQRERFFEPSWRCAKRGSYGTPSGTPIFTCIRKSLEAVVRRASRLRSSSAARAGTVPAFDRVIEGRVRSTDNHQTTASLASMSVAAELGMASGSPRSLAADVLPDWQPVPQAVQSRPVLWAVTILLIILRRSLGYGTCCGRLPQGVSSSCSWHCPGRRLQSYDARTGTGHSAGFDLAQPTAAYLGEDGSIRFTRPPFLVSAANDHASSPTPTICCVSRGIGRSSRLRDQKALSPFFSRLGQVRFLHG